VVFWKRRPEPGELIFVFQGLAAQLTESEDMVPLGAAGRSLRAVRGSSDGITVRL